MSLALGCYYLYSDQKSLHIHRHIFTHGIWNTVRFIKEDLTCYYSDKLDCVDW